MPREVAIVCQEQKAFGVEIEPPDGDEPGQVFGQSLEHGRPSLGVFMRRDASLGLVITPKPWRLAGGQRLSVDQNLIGRRYVQRRALDHRAVHRHALFPNQDFGVPPGAKP